VNIDIKPVQKKVVPQVIAVLAPLFLPSPTPIFQRFITEP
jgi:hypothetical protein